MPNLVLVVDDDPPTLALLRESLNDPAWDVIGVADLDAASEVIASNQVDVIVLDRFLDSVDAVGFLTQLQAQSRTALIPVIMLSGVADAAARLQGLQAGALDYVDKDVAPREVKARVNAHVRRAELARRLSHQQQVDQDLLVECSAALARCSSSEDHTRTLRSRAVTVPGADFALIIPLDPRLSGLPVRVSAAAKAAGARPTAGHRDDAVPPQLLSIPAGPVRVPAQLRVLAELVGCEVAWAHATPINDGGTDLALLVVASVATPADPDRLIRLIRAITRMSSDGLSLQLATERVAMHDQEMLHRALAGDGVRPVYHQVVSTADRTVVGYEALTRFADGLPPGPRFRFAKAAGHGVDLELMAIVLQLHSARHLPGGHWLAINASPAALTDHRLADALKQHDGQVVIEMTEHDPIGDYDVVRRRLRALPNAPKLSIDDAGAGYACLAHVLALRPDFVKLDRVWVSGIDTDPARQALVAGVRRLAAETGSTLIAEGVERHEELDALQALDVELVQGYLLSMPAEAHAVATATG